MEHTVEFHAADLTSEAVACARDNLASRGEVHQGDLYKALPDHMRGRIDVLLANTPYVPTAANDLLPPEARPHDTNSAPDVRTAGHDLALRMLDGGWDWSPPGGAG